MSNVPNGENFPKAKFLVYAETEDTQQKMIVALAIMAFIKTLTLLCL